MKKAVIATGGRQYVVSEGETLEVGILKTESKSIDFPALLLLDGEKTTVGRPIVKDVKVSATIVDPEVKGDKVLAVRYKAKKRVNKIRGHRQLYTRVKIGKIG